MDLKRIKGNLSVTKIFFAILIFAMICYVFLLLKSKMDLYNAVFVFFIPLAWTAYVTAFCILLWILISKFYLKSPYVFMKEWGARLLALVAGAELLIWTGLLAKNIWNETLDQAFLEELIFPLVLSVSLLVLAAVFWKKRNIVFKDNIILLVISVLLFILPRESGNLKWNINHGKYQTHTDASSCNNTSFINWAGRSKIPADHNARYSIASSSVSGSVGKILGKKMAASDSVNEDEAYVTVTGTIRSPFLGSYFPFIKFGTVRADLLVNINYGISTFGFDKDNSDARSFNFSSSITLNIKSQRMLFGIASGYDFNEKAADEIYSIIRQNIEKELGY